MYGASKIRVNLRKVSSFRRFYHMVVSHCILKIKKKCKPLNWKKKQEGSPDYQINWHFGSEEEVQNRFPR